MPQIEFRVGGQSRTVEADERDTILDTALRHGINAPYSCMEGVCQSCLAILREGKVEAPPGSDQPVQESGVEGILTCQLRPRKNCGRLIVDYDAV